MKFNLEAKFDAVVIGSGISGLLCALELAKNNKTVCIVTKEAVTESSSLYAQGGIAVPLSLDDSIEKHLRDTLIAGAGLCDEKIAREIISYSLVAFSNLQSYGVKFDTDLEGKTAQTKEAAHSLARVCHIGGDLTGKYMTKALIDKACREQNISISQGTFVLDIVLNEDGEASGVLVEDVTKSCYFIGASNVILASGGIGQIYKNTTNPNVSTGDGLAIAYRANAHLQDIEMIQFHPTTLANFEETYLITEAVRGEGGRLKNVNGYYFAKDYHKDAELAPRDILARAILSEIIKSNSSCVYLDVSSFSPEYFKNRFPNVYQNCIDKKIDIFKTGIPVVSGAHYFIGGVKCDISGKTSVPGLWTVGEIASNGFHGANRLASNSLLECIVSPYFLVQALLSEKNNKVVKKEINLEFDLVEYKENEIKKIKEELKEKNLACIGLIRNGDKLSEHLKWLNNLIDKYNVVRLFKGAFVQEFKNMVYISYLICNASLERKHSIGVFYREDFKEKPVIPAHNILVKDSTTELKVCNNDKRLLPFNG